MLDGRTDEQTVMTTLIAALRNFVNAPKNARKNKHTKKKHARMYLSHYGGPIKTNCEAYNYFLSKFNDVS
jgi:hypothetical protein